jgi:hypothetical protein
MIKFYWLEVHLVSALLFIIINDNLNDFYIYNTLQKICIIIISMTKSNPKDIKYSSSQIYASSTRISMPLFILVFQLVACSIHATVYLGL